MSLSISESAQGITAHGISAMARRSPPSHAFSSSTCFAQAGKRGGCPVLPLYAGKRTAPGFPALASRSACRVIFLTRGMSAGCTKKWLHVCGSLAIPARTLENMPSSGRGLSANAAPAARASSLTSSALQPPTTTAWMPISR